MRYSLLTLCLTLGLGWAQELRVPDPSLSFSDQVRAAALDSLAANSRVLEERAALYQGDGAAAALATLRQRVAETDALLTQSAQLLQQLTWLGRERQQVGRLMDGGPVEVTEANRAFERIRREEAALANALVESAAALRQISAEFPEATRFVQVDRALIETALHYTDRPVDPVRATLPAGDADALEAIFEEFVWVQGDIEDAMEQLRDGSLNPFALDGTANAVLQALRETNPEAAAAAAAELRRWRARRDAGQAIRDAAEIALFAGAIFTGGALAPVMRGSLAVVGVANTADSIGHALQVRALANTSLDRHGGLASQSDARRATLDAVVQSALLAGEGALVLRNGIRVTRPVTDMPSAPAATPSGSAGTPPTGTSQPTHGLVGALTGEAPTPSGIRPGGGPTRPTPGAPTAVARTPGDPRLGGFRDGISPDEIRAINRQFGGQIEATGVAETALANASRYDGFWMRTASIVRDIAGRHLFDNGNKRTAQAVVELLLERNNVLNAVSPIQIRRIIREVAEGRLTEVRDIARALRGD